MKHIQHLHPSLDFCGQGHRLLQLLTQRFEGSPKRGQTRSRQAVTLTVRVPAPPDLYVFELCDWKAWRTVCCARSCRQSYL